MKQASRLQKQMEAAQQELAQRTVETSSGGGVVKVVARCDGSIQSITIDPQAVDSEEVQLLEDMVLSAVNSSLQKAKEVSAEQMSRLTGGMNIPGLA
jgi:DNA-binding YbaB/EbfC family protein